MRKKFRRTTEKIWMKPLINKNIRIRISARQIRWFGGVSHQIFSICHQKSEAGGLVKPPKIFR